MPTTHQTAPVRVDSAQSQPLRPRWKLAVLVTVLLGFFLMHGLSGADSCAGALASLPDDAQSSVAMVAANTAAPSAAAAQVVALNGTEAQGATIRGSSQAAQADDQCCAMGTLCVPQRPQDQALLLVLLLIGLAMPVNGSSAGRLIDAIARMARTRRRRTGTATPTRLLVCISRT
jgi:hypothetical protein